MHQINGKVLGLLNKDTFCGSCAALTKFVLKGNSLLCGNYDSPIHGIEDDKKAECIELTNHSGFILKNENNILNFYSFLT